jgi:hypothetical protein
MGCITPKNIDSFRDIYTSFKSPPTQLKKKGNHTNKLSSMPVSPGK